MTYEPAFQDTDKSLLQDLTELVGAVFHHGKLLPPRSDRGRRSGECFSIHFRQNELGQLILTFNSPLSFPSSFCCNAKECVHKLLHKQRWEDGNFWQKRRQQTTGEEPFSIACSGMLFHELQVKAGRALPFVQGKLESSLMRLFENIL